MLDKKIQAAALAFMISSSSFAHAGSITVGSAGVSDPAFLETFDKGSAGSNLSGQFGDHGLTFATLGTNGITLAAKATCNNLGGTTSNKYLAMGLKWPCSSDTAVNGASIKFAQNVGELSWFGFSRATVNGFSVQALLDGQVVSEIAFDGANRFENQMVHFTGSSFDEIRFLEAAGFQGYFGLDNMAWKLAPEPASGGKLPLPGTVALFGIGIAGLGLMRRKNAAPAR